MGRRRIGGLRRLEGQPQNQLRRRRRGGRRSDGERGPHRIGGLERKEEPLQQTVAPGVLDLCQQIEEELEFEGGFNPSNLTRGSGAELFGGEELITPGGDQRNESQFVQVVPRLPPGRRETPRRRQMRCAPSPLFGEVELVTVEALPIHFEETSELHLSEGDPRVEVRSPLRLAILDPGPEYLNVCDV